MKNRTLDMGIGIIIGLGILSLAFAFSLLFRPTKTGAVAGQIVAKMATSSTVTISGGTTSVRMFATSTCASRVITTNADPVRFTLGDITGFTLSSAAGHTQLASTTVAYDGSVYGCGSWQVLNAGPSGNTAVFQVTETF